MMNTINGKQYTNKEAHKILWNWLADNPDKSNEDFFKNNICSSVPHNFCYACEDARRNCKYCLTWISNKVFGDAPCYNYNSILVKYKNAKGIEKEKLAKEIANMQWNN